MKKKNNSVPGNRTVNELYFSWIEISPFSDLTSNNNDFCFSFIYNLNPLFA